MTRPRVYPILPWLIWALIVPLALVALGAVLVASIQAQTLLFDHPNLWWLGGLVPVAGLVVLLARYGKSRALARFASADLAPLLAQRISPAKQAFRAGLVVLAITCLVAGVIGPRWGIYLTKEKVRGVDVVVALDVSRSMLATDVAPNRLAAAKMQLRQQLTERTVFKRANRFGLIAFAGTTSLRMPLTTDTLAFRQKLDALSPSDVPVGGTAIAQAIRRGVDLFHKSPEDATKVLLLVTDGEDHEGDPVAQAQLAWEDNHVHVYTVGVGDPSLTVGARVPQSAHSSKPILYDGQIVFSKVNVDALRQVAEVGEGQYVPLPHLNKLVDAIAAMHQSELSTEERIRHKPRYQWFVLAALLALTLETLMRDGRSGEVAAPQRVWQQEALA